jgi:hypothetical protein
VVDAGHNTTIIYSSITSTNLNLLNFSDNDVPSTLPLKYLCIPSAECIYMIHIIVIINSDHILKQQKTTTVVKQMGCVFCKRKTEVLRIVQMDFLLTNFNMT